MSGFEDIDDYPVCPVCGWDTRQKGMPHWIAFDSDRLPCYLHSKFCSVGHGIEYDPRFNFDEVGAIRCGMCSEPAKDAIRTDILKVLEYDKQRQMKFRKV